MSQLPDSYEVRSVNEMRHTLEQGLRHIATVYGFKSEADVLASVPKLLYVCNRAEQLLAELCGSVDGMSSSEDDGCSIPLKDWRELVFNLESPASELLKEIRSVIAIAQPHNTPPKNSES